MADQRNQEGAFTGPPVLLRTEQAQALLNIGRPLLFQLLASGELESCKVGRLRMIPREAIDTFIERRMEVDRQKRSSQREKES